jgi:hypothetical protein
MRSQPSPGVSKNEERITVSGEKRTIAIVVAASHHQKDEFLRVFISLSPPGITKKRLVA